MGGASSLNAAVCGREERLGLGDAALIVMGCGDGDGEGDDGSDEGDTAVGTFRAIKYRK